MTSISRPGERRAKSRNTANAVITCNLPPIHAWTIEP
jgi:hypothetical protein